MDKIYAIVQTALLILCVILKFTGNLDGKLFGIIWMLCLIVPAFIYLLIRKISKLPKHNNGITKKEITSNNKYLNENMEKLEKLYDESYKMLEPYKKRIIYSIIIEVFILISVFLVNHTIPVVQISMGAFFMLTIVLVYLYRNKKYDIYKEIVKKVLHDYNSDLEYKQDAVFTLEEYYSCLFPEACDCLHSEDVVVNLKKGFYYSDIVAYYSGEADNATVEFRGSLARVDIKNTNCKIFLGSTKGKLLYGDKEYKKINFENDEFNKLFQACTDNEVLAYKILTPDVLEQFVFIKNNTFGNIDIRIINDKLYIRFLSKNNFVNYDFNKRKEKNALCQSIAVIEEVMKTMEKVKMIIDNKNTN